MDRRAIFCSARDTSPSDWPTVVYMCICLSGAVCCFQKHATSQHSVHDCADTVVPVLCCTFPPSSALSGRMEFFCWFLLYGERLVESPYNKCVWTLLGTGVEDTLGEVDRLRSEFLAWVSPGLCFAASLWRSEDVSPTDVVSSESPILPTS